MLASAAGTTGCSAGRGCDIRLEPKKVIQALIDPSWIKAMQDELLQFKLQQIWILVDLRYGKRAIETKWIYRNKKDDRGIVVRNKARLVAQGYTQEEGIYYDEVFALVTRIEAIRLKEICTEFEKMMHKKFQISSMRELTFFLGLQVTQKDDGIFISQDNDYAGASLDRKSTTGGCQFLGRRLISWQCKKQTLVANSTTEAEYVVASSSYGQVLWIQNQLLDYGYNFMNTKIFIDNESTICIVKNSVFHSKTKHIEIRHHFIRDSYEKELIQVIKIHTNHNVADLLTKAFDVSRFQYLITSIGMLNL
ncbi:putative ribonuclease H-like domain-containing protein [Tanacetum coccineum]|uniref:Ribonuclease H-like domain-containing protein n=1 Tax=Tanacetum coccineum TaxID=301880 RepID=A0ABQ5I075_9ASTR